MAEVALHRVVVGTREEGDRVLSILADVLSRYDEVSISDLYELVGLPTSYPHTLWGWTSLDGFGLKAVEDGYAFQAPAFQRLDR